MVMSSTTSFSKLASCAASLPSFLIQVDSSSNFFVMCSSSSNHSMRLARLSFASLGGGLVLMFL